MGILKTEELVPCDLQPYLTVTAPAFTKLSCKIGISPMWPKANLEVSNYTCMHCTHQPSQEQQTHKQQEMSNINTHAQ